MQSAILHFLACDENRAEHLRLVELSHIPGRALSIAIHTLIPGLSFSSLHFLDDLL